MPSSRTQPPAPPPPPVVPAPLPSGPGQCRANDDGPSPAETMAPPAAHRAAMDFMEGRWHVVRHGPRGRERRSRIRSGGDRGRGRAPSGVAGTPHARARIDLAAIRANVSRLCDTAGSAEVMAVVKADAYGHGAVPVARAALAGGATWLGVAGMREALALRTAGVPGRLLAWLLTPGDDWSAAVAAGVELSAGAPWAVRAAVRAAQAVDRPALLHLEAETGPGRVRRRGRLADAGGQRGVRRSGRVSPGGRRVVASGAGR